MRVVKAAWLDACSNRQLGAGPGRPERDVGSSRQRHAVLRTWLPRQHKQQNYGILSALLIAELVKGRSGHMHNTPNCLTRLVLAQFRSSPP